MSGLGIAPPLELAIFVGALATFGALALLFDGSGARRRRRDRRIAALASATPGGSERPTPSIRQRQQPETTVWRRLAERALLIGPGFAERLAFSGVTVPPGRFRLLMLVLAIVGATAVLAATGSPVIALGTGHVLYVGTARAVIAVMTMRLRSRFLVQFPDAIDLMIRSLRAGLPIDEAIIAVGAEGGDAVAPEFRRVGERLALGMSLEDSLWRSARRLALPDLDFFVICLTVQRETGGKLTETLANLSDILRRRLQMRLKVQAMSAQARTSAGIIGSLPFILAIALYFANPAYLAGLFDDPRGRMILAAGLASEAFGIITMIRMARFRI